jgi:hypothetical protein
MSEEKKISLSLPGLRNLFIHILISLFTEVLHVILLLLILSVFDFCFIHSLPLIPSSFAALCAALPHLSPTLLRLS